MKNFLKDSHLSKFLIVTSYSLPRPLTPKTKLIPSPTPTNFTEITNNNMDLPPEQAPFEPTHLIYLNELDQNEKETYYDLLIAADANFHKNYETGDVMADMRILGPGVRISTTPPKKKKDDGMKRLNPREKLAVQALKNASVSLPGAITCDNGDVFDYKRYESVVKLIRGSETPTYSPKRRPLAWVMRLIHEIYDVRYARDTSDINEEDEWDDTDPDVIEARRKVRRGGKGGRQIHYQLY